MSASTHPFRLLPSFLVAAPLLLAHCSGSTWADPDNAVPAAQLDFGAPLDASGAAAVSPVGQPVTVRITMVQTGPGTCSNDDGPGGCGAVGNSTEVSCVVCQGPGTSLEFQLTAVGCDDDLCNVTSIQRGDATTGDTVTLVPLGATVTLRAAGTSGSLVASASLQVAADCTNARDVPGCP